MENAKKFKDLYDSPVEGHTEDKNVGNGVSLTYLSWAYAWATLCENDPLANYKVHKDGKGNNYFSDGITAYVETEVSAFGKTIEQELPVMDNRNQSIPVANITSFAVNKSIQRCLTKNIAMFGLGLKLYAGEDLPDSDGESDDEPNPDYVRRPAPASPKPQATGPSQGQLNFIKTLASERNVSPDDAAKAGQSLTPSSSAQASALIDWLMKLPKQGAKPKEEPDPDDKLPF